MDGSTPLVSHNRVHRDRGGAPTGNTCFYFNLASQKKQLLASVLGALLKKVVSGMAKVESKLRKPMKTRKRWLDNRDSGLILSRWYKLPPQESPR